MILQVRPACTATRLEVGLQHTEQRSLRHAHPYGTDLLAHRDIGVWNLNYKTLISTSPPKKAGHDLLVYD